MIEVRGLKKNFKNFEALKGIDFIVAKGEVLGLLGENGAGKTTTLRILATMLKPDGGTVKLNGKNVLDSANEIRKEIGILFGGESGIYDRLTARENIVYYGELNDMTKDEIDDRIKHLVKVFNMEEYIDRRAGKFSKGMKQKVAIARSIVHNPSIMLFDEPTSGLDVGGARIIQQFIETCKAEGKTVIFSSHSMAEVEKLCDRVAVIHKGKIVESGYLKEIKEKYDKNMEDLFLELVGEGNEL
ncbi:ABC transporter ATP-binding protein [Alkaliphilus hydrothermalis]|uniref:Sodium transport system ATP-binding protein n=1 Tax=Alkaliphilus hydrothermalis TaxID=1482730 RepID=A0ABS2NQV0_9FIRM|nr:ATP-binding cassette domain-containing protein [Alkaliphilus hydrothermalis]MBM7615333.1 sodium transport system ATP-binding protein [Alkaliphilus hydrothermalis]